MRKKLRTKDGDLEVSLNRKKKFIEIESNRFKDVAVEVRIPDPTDPLTPRGALFRIELYRYEENAKVHPFEYDFAWVMSDGKILKKGKEYAEDIRKQSGY